MRLDEITRPRNKAELFQILQSRGWQKINESGRMSFVFSNPSKDYVLKVWTITDRAYLDYLKFIQEHPNKHFPKLRGKPMVLVPGLYYAIRLEKLKPAVDSIDVHMALDYGDLFEEFYSEDNDPNSEFGEEEIEFMSNFEKEYPSMANALALIVSKLLTRYKHHKCDFVIENFMQRSNGELVITDPIASY
jgi:hypothetical protein